MGLVVGGGVGVDMIVGVCVGAGVGVGRPAAGGAGGGDPIPQEAHQGTGRHYWRKGEEDLRAEEEKSRAGKVQVCAGL